MKRFFLCFSIALLTILVGCSDGDILSDLGGGKKIYYTTIDGKKIQFGPLSGSFDAVLVSNTYDKDQGCLTFDEKVTEIGDYAFLSCENLVSITIPDSVTSIGVWAFSSCESLTSITIPDGVTSIGDYAFCDCSSLTSVYCKPATPPSGDSRMFDYNASDRKIYVPTESVYAYKTAEYWNDYADAIVGYNF